MRHRATLGAALSALAAALLLFGAGPAHALLDADDFDLDWDDGEIIVIELDDQRTFDTAVLVAPDGSEIAAFRIDRDRETSTSGTGSGVSTGVGVGGGSGGFGVGVGIGFPLGGGEETTYVSYETEAQIRVPDMAEYRAGWTQWVLRIHLPADGPSTERTIEMPAPEPPD